MKIEGYVVVLSMYAIFVAIVHTQLLRRGYGMPALVGTLVIFLGAWAVISLAFFGVKYQLFGLRLKNWSDMRTKWAMIHKRFRFPMWTYGYEVLDKSPKFGTLWELTAPKHIRVAHLCRHDRYEASNMEARRRVLEVRDATTNKRYFLGVPRARHTATAKGAAAWTFGKSERDYSPAVET